MSQTSHPAFSPTSVDIVSADGLDAPRARRSVVRAIGRRMARVAFVVAVIALTVLLLLIYAAARAVSVVGQVVSRRPHGVGRSRRTGWRRPRPPA